ncbi:MAG: serine/threonine-protein kinase [Actinomycetota bacterium]|nr:serine/threonine-protein kinase [Actinomycetota bacterium]
MQYEVLRRLGRGGMGRVDLARATSGELVAVKRIPLLGSPAEADEARRRIRREAELLSRLDHPGIIRLLDVLSEEDDIVLVMEYCEGGTLHERVTRGGPLPPEQLDALADWLLSALAVAHRAGVVHRDVKPANVLFGADGRPRLADFGVAAHRDASRITGTNLIVGTADYMSPEQAKGQDATAASDVFAAGATLYFAATGRSPWGEGELLSVLRRAAKGQVAPLPRSLPRPLRHRIEAMLDRRPDRRPSAAAAAGGPAGTMVGRAPRPGARRLLAGGTIAVLVLAIAAVSAALVTGWAPGDADGEELGAPGTSAPAAPTSDGDGGSTTTGETTTTTEATTTTTVPTTTTTTCTPLPLELECGVPAPNTDGEVCLDDFADYDGEVANGCEAAPDDPDGNTLDDTLAANLVPAEDVDVWSFEVGDGINLRCDGRLEVTLQAPNEAIMRLDVREDDADGDLRGSAISSDGEESTVTIRESCVGDDAGTYVAVVSWIGPQRTADPYILERSGSF